MNPRDAADIVMSPHPDGETYDPDRDHERLAKQRGRVYRCLRVDRWWTLAQLAAAAGGPEQSVSARIRDLRKPRFGSFTIDKRYAGHGLWEYRLDPEDGIVDCAA
jgi:hypothetical protein